MTKSRILLAGFAFLLMVGCSTEAPTRAPADIEFSDAPLPGKFVWYDLLTDDVTTARGFYGELFGWRFQDGTTPRGDGDYTLILAGERLIGGIVYLADSGEAEYSRWLPYVSVANVDAAAEVTLQAGGTVLVPPTEVGDVARVAALQDPSGAVLGVIRSHYGDPVDLPLADYVFGWNELLTDTPGVAASFYAQLTGIDAVTINRRGGAYTLLSRDDVNRAGILERPGEGSVDTWVTHVAVPDVAATVAATTRLGGAVIVAPALDIREGTLALIADPTGAVIAISQREALHEDIR